MKKLIIPIVFGLLVCMAPMNLFAKTICFAGGGGAAGQFLFLSGGKPDQKPFSGNWFLGANSTVPTWGAYIIDSFGMIQISWCSPHSPDGTTTTSFCGSVSGATTAALLGQYDNFQDGTFDGALILTEVNCNTVPPAKPEALVSGGQGFPTKSEK